MSPPPHSYDDGLDEEVWEDLEDDLYSEDTEAISSEPEPPREQLGLAWPDPFDTGTEASSPAGEAQRLAPSPDARPGDLGAGPPPEALGSRSEASRSSASGWAGRRQRDPSSGRSSDGARRRGHKRRGRWDAPGARATGPPAWGAKARRRHGQAPDFAGMSSLEMNDYVRWWRKMHAATWQRGALTSARPSSRALPAAAAAAASSAAIPPPPPDRPADEEEDAMLQEALRLSLQQDAPGPASAPGAAFAGEAAPALVAASGASAARA